MAATKFVNLQCLVQGDHLGRFGHIVDAEQMRASVHGPSVQGSRTVQAS